MGSWKIVLRKYWAYKVTYICRINPGFLKKDFGTWWSQAPRMVNIFSRSDGVYVYLDVNELTSPSLDAAGSIKLVVCGERQRMTGKWELILLSC